MDAKEREIIVVGAGPAGLSAALTIAYYKADVLVLEAASAGGALINAYPWKRVDNYLGFSGKNGLEVTEEMVRHVRAEGVEIRENEPVLDIKKEGSAIRVQTNRESYSAKAVILAIGLGMPRKLGVKGEDLEGVVYCLPDPNAYQGKRILVVGGGDTALECAAELQKNHAQAMIAHRRDSFRATKKNILCLEEACVRVLWNTQVSEIIGVGKVETVALKNNRDGIETIEDFDNVLIAAGTAPNTDFLGRIGVKTSENKVLVDPDMRTNIEGVFAAGDVVGKWVRIPQAIGEGGLAGLNAFKYVKNPYWK